MRFSAHLIDALSVLAHRAFSLIGCHVRRRLRQSPVLHVLQPELPEYIRLDGVDPSPSDVDRRLVRVEGVVRVWGPGRRVSGGRIVERPTAAAERRHHGTDGPRDDHVEVGTHDVRQRRGGPRRRGKTEPDNIVDYIQPLSRRQLPPFPIPPI